MKFFAWLFSVLFHPSLLFFYGYLFIIKWFPQYRYSLDNSTLIFLGLSLFVYTLLVPWITLLILKKSGKISSLLLPKREDRQWSYFYLILCYGFWYYQLYNLGMPGPALTYALGAIFMVIISFIFNFFDKVSAHAAGWGGLISLVVIIGFVQNQEVRFWLALILGVCGLTLSSRLWLQAHNPAQIWKGLWGGMMGMELAFYLDTLKS